MMTVYRKNQVLYILLYKADAVRILKYLPWWGFMSKLVNARGEDDGRLAGLETSYRDMLQVEALLRSVFRNRRILSNLEAGVNEDVKSETNMRVQAPPLPGAGEPCTILGVTEEVAYRIGSLSAPVIEELCRILDYRFPNRGSGPVTKEDRTCFLNFLWIFQCEHEGRAVYEYTEETKAFFEKQIVRGWLKDLIQPGGDVTVFKQALKDWAKQVGPSVKVRDVRWLLHHLHGDIYGG